MKSLTKLLVILLLFFVQQKNMAQFSDSLKFIKPDLIHTSLIFTATFAAGILTDEFIQQTFQNNQNSFGDKYFDVMNSFGDTKYAIPLVLSPLLASYLFKDKKLKKTSYDAIKSAIVTGLITQGFKQAFGRARPYMDIGAYDFDLFRLGGNDYLALPSGHTSLAFSIFTPFAETYSRWLYIVPVSVGLARIYKNKHWFSDVVLGAALGYFSGRYFTFKEKSSIVFKGNGFVLNF